jgi:hypothetical protein
MAARIQLKPLPDKESKEYLPTVIENVVTAFKRFLSDSMALDYCGVLGKTRSFVLDSKEYKGQTKKIKAEAYLDELDDIEAIVAELKGSEVNESDYDMRDSKQVKTYNKDYKDLFAMQLKANELRRNLLQLSQREDEAEEADALNIFFVPVTREEFDAMVTVEIHDGEEDASEALSAEVAKNAAEQLMGARTEAQEMVDEHEMIGGYKVNEDGSVEDWSD